MFEATCPFTMPGMFAAFLYNGTSQLFFGLVVFAVTSVLAQAAMSVISARRAAAREVEAVGRQVEVRAESGIGEA